MLKRIILILVLTSLAVVIYHQVNTSNGVVQQPVSPTNASSTQDKATPSTEEATADQTVPKDTSKPKETIGNTAESTPTQQAVVSNAFLQQRQPLLNKLSEIEDCENNGLCPYNDNDPKQAMFKQEAMLVKALQQLQELHQNHQVFDITLTEVTGQYLGSPLGRVQMQAIQMFAQQPKSEANAQVLISALHNSYDSKVMATAMSVLAEYPNQRQRFEDMLIQTLKTGSVYVSRTVAREVRHILTPQNISQFEKVAASLPQNSAKAKILKASISDFKLTNQ